MVRRSARILRQSFWNGALGGLSQERFEFAEDLLDPGEIR
jgi:hypothetical protein